MQRPLAWLINLGAFELHTSQPNPSQMLVIDPVLVVCSMVIHICYNCGYCLVMGKSRNIMRGPSTISGSAIALPM